MAQATAVAQTLIPQDSAAFFLWETIKGAVGELGDGFFEVVFVSGDSVGERRVGFMCETTGRRGFGEVGMRVLGVSDSKETNPAQALHTLTTQPKPRIIVTHRTPEGKYLDSWAWELRPHTETSGTHYALHPRTTLDKNTTHKAAPKVNTIPQTITAAIEAAHLTHLTGTHGELTYTSGTTTETYNAHNLHTLPTRLLNRKAGDTITLNGHTWSTDGGTFEGEHPLHGVTPDLESNITQAALDSLTSTSAPTAGEQENKWVGSIAPNATEDTQLIINALNEKTRTINSTAVTFYGGEPMIEHPGMVRALIKNREQYTIIVQRFDDAPTAANPGSVYGFTTENTPMSAAQCASKLQEVGLMD